MASITGDQYLESLVKFVQSNTESLIGGSLVLKLNPIGLHYVQSRLDALHELESIISGAPSDYLRAYISDLGDHRALEQLRRILRLLTSLKVVSALPPHSRDTTSLSFHPFGRIRVLELRGCDLSSSPARSLLELRHTLEKFICQNSTDALRHVFASRVTEIEDSPHWNRLSVISCPCNGLVLMDESLQLLPTVETLDLSRNKLTKLDNLQKCVSLSHLDLGFNHLKTISSFNQVSCRLVKLVLRNNALSTLSGIENLKSLEGIDLSHNLISRATELEYLALIPSLRCLWLEGNPLCCLPWYRANLFSFFLNPYRLEVDDKRISMKEIWQMRIILSSKKRRAASFGFYAPVCMESKGEDPVDTKKTKFSRVASIEGEEAQSLYIDRGSPRGSEGRNVQDYSTSDGDSEISGLIRRIELAKKENVPEPSSDVGEVIDDFLWYNEGWLNYVEDESGSESSDVSDSDTSGYDGVGTSGSDDGCENGPSTSDPGRLEGEILVHDNNVEFTISPSGDGGSREKKVGRRRAKRRIVSLSEDAMT